MGRGKGSWVRREKTKTLDATGARRAHAGAPTTTCPFPSESSVAWPSPVRAHTHMRAHNHMRASQCLAPYGEVRRVFKRDQFSLSIIYIFLKNESSSVVEAAGELEASRRAACRRNQAAEAAEGEGPRAAEAAGPRGAGAP